MPVTDYTPDVAAVATYLRARTKTAGGQEAGTFNPDSAVGTRDETRPTAEQVDTTVQNYIGGLSPIIGVDVPAAYIPLASRVAALGSALLIELTYFPEQVATGRSPYAQLKELYDELTASLYSALGIATDSGDIVPEDAGYPSYGGFPMTGIGMEMPW